MAASVAQPGPRRQAASVPDAVVVMGVASCRDEFRPRHFRIDVLSSRARFSDQLSTGNAGGNE